MNWAIYGMVYLGSALMVYNIYFYVCYIRSIQNVETWGKERNVLYIPLALLVSFLLGYLLVGFLGKPDLIVSGILFGGSLFVCIIFRLLQRITERIQENEHLEAELMAAEQSSKAKSNFLSSVSHEMRTPMNAIIGLDTLALQQDGLPDTVRTQLTELGANARYLMQLIDNILDMSTLESGKVGAREDVFSLRELIEQLSLITRNRCNENGLEYAVNIDPTLDEAYIGDATRLRQALLSILDNAVKFTPSPGKVSFDVRQGRTGDGRRALRFDIRDTGVGIDESFLPRLFEPFSQEDESFTNRYGGSGLGLAIAENMIRIMGGRIEVHSEKGRGSRFTVTVALKPAELPPSAAPVGEETATPEAEVELRGRRMLIVEDIDINAEILADLLEIEEVESERAENGQVAVDMFSQSDEGYYDAVLMDLRMPVMDGFEATRAIRALPRADAGTVPILAISANASAEDQKRALDSGMDAHLPKPLDIDDLCERLKTILAEKGQPD